MQSPTYVGHPKLDRLESVVLAHFISGNDTRIIVFSEYRESVADICKILLKHQPLVRPSEFVGKGSQARSRGKSVTQKVCADDFNLN